MVGYRCVSALLLLLPLIVGESSPAASVETKSYAVEWFSLASYSQQGDCPDGVNPPTREQYPKDLQLLGYSPEQVKQIMDDWVTNDQPRGGFRQPNAENIFRNRGRIDGKPVNAFIYPWAVPDPQLHWVKGRYALGFNLDGKAGPNDFEEPITHEHGIDNQLFRALGCIEQFRGTYKDRPTFWAFFWGSIRESAPAWLLTLSGQNLEADGPVTITFDRASEHLMFDPTGEATADATYRIDPDPRSHHVFQGEIRNGVVSITQPGDLSLLFDPLSFPVFRLKDTHLRLTQSANGNLDGLIGGYQPWNDIYFSLGLGGLAVENMVINDVPADWYLLKKMADADPDPATGQNRAISAAYRLEAVPVFAVPAEPARDAAAGRVHTTGR
jgi:hypothetical protein